MNDKSPTTKDLVSFVENLKDKWLATVDSLIDPLLIVDDQYTISQLNKAAAKLSRSDKISDLIGKKCYKVIADLDHPCKGCKMKSSKKTNTYLTYEIDKIRGESIYEVSSKPFYDSHGKYEGSLQVYKDRTKAKILEQQLLQREKLASIGLLAGGVAHEINNPLGGILIFSQVILKSMDPQSPHYSDVVEIEAAAQRCKEIVLRLLDFARKS